MRCLTKEETLFQAHEKVRHALDKKNRRDIVKMGAMRPEDNDYGEEPEARVRGGRRGVSDGLTAGPREREGEGGCAHDRLSLCPGPKSLPSLMPLRGLRSPKGCTSSGRGGMRA